MGKRKITCNNNSCKHHTNGGCDTCITLDGSGKCKSFEKGFAYYFHIVWDALDNKNFIDMVEIRMNPDLKTGLFYVMECYDLGFSEMEWGTCRMVMLKDGKEGKPLKYEEIIEREMNMEKFSKHLENFNNGIMPQMQQEQDAAGQQDNRRQCPAPANRRLSIRKRNRGKKRRYRMSLHYSERWQQQKRDAVRAL